MLFVGIGLLTALAGAIEIDLVVTGNYTVLSIGKITSEVIITIAGMLSLPSTSPPSHLPFQESSWSLQLCIIGSKAPSVSQCSLGAWSGGVMITLGPLLSFASLWLTLLNLFLVPIASTVSI
jgi:hypothetical protein